MCLIATFLALSTALYSAPLSAAPPARPRCRINWETQSMEFLDSRGTVKKRIRTVDEKKQTGNITAYHKVALFGCNSGQAGAVLELHGRCENGCEVDGPPLAQKYVLRYYSSSGKLRWSEELWKETPTYLGADMLRVSANDQMVVFSSSAGITGIDANGQHYQAELPALGSPVVLSPSGMYGACQSIQGKCDYIFFDLQSGATHCYVGPGIPEISDDGKVKVWEHGVILDRARRKYFGKMYATFSFHPIK